MKTIAITIDEDTLNAIEELAKKSPARARSRSRLIRAAIKEYVAKQSREVREEREREILKRHRTRLERQARALISEQAKP
jgi:metal-responsive CopG/Arc/MetJ family transcriptional regulator